MYSGKIYIEFYSYTIMNPNYSYYNLYPLGTKTIKTMQTYPHFIFSHSLNFTHTNLKTRKVVIYFIRTKPHKYTM